ncbi:hypothetical protein [Desulfatitalea alkaliphila]|uniref:DUF362 domain-containing protein n=1 Tax=Desulfatitalea alkaliphila TaxID=2929485 RepID=A0AA41UKE8_9BACT|nr:hypothetical protein [Desulfatitalea alkaliphila]MCJ8502995.1 hypothetical protein [Desulfatitalea alkaliphila]
MEKKLWEEFGMTRRTFLRHFGIASCAITLGPFFVERFATAIAQVPERVKVFKVSNGDCFENIDRLWAMMGGVGNYIDADDFVVIKGNGQWPYQGYTHTGCIKAVIDAILRLPGYDGEIFVCDNVQEYGGLNQTGFDATVAYRTRNWPDHNWDSLAAAYRAEGKPVAAKRWVSSQADITGPGDGEGWIRDFFAFHGRDSYLSYPVFESPLTPGCMVDVKNGVWRGGGYTGRRVKTLFMPNLNNHGSGGEDYAGVTSAVKSFFGATEIHNGGYATFRGHYNMHSTSYARSRADYAGELTARFIRTMYAPSLYITAAMWAGHQSRTGGAVETKTVLACENPVTLDYVACKEVIAPHAAWLDPDQDNNTRRQLTGCIAGGVGTIDPGAFEVVAYDFDRPTVHRLDVDRMIKEFEAGRATEQEVIDLIQAYMDGG